MKIISIIVLLIISSLQLINGQFIEIKEEENDKIENLSDMLTSEEKILEKIKGEGMNDYDNKGYTPLMNAAMIGDVKIVETYLKAGANMKLRSKIGGNTALMLAVERNYYLTTDTLIKKGADIFERNNAGLSPILVAVSRSYVEVTELLLTAGASPNESLNIGLTVLMMACQSGAFDLVKLLITKGANINSRSISLDTPLMYSAIVGRTDIVEYLIQAGADGNAGNNKAQTALMLAAARGHDMCVLKLIEKGVDIEARDYSEMSAFDHAQEKGEASTMKILLSYGATARYGVDMDSETKEKREIALAKIRQERDKKEAEKRALEEEQQHHQEL